jgi:hypothetical protein
MLFIRLKKTYKCQVKVKINFKDSLKATWDTKSLIQIILR